MTEEELKRFNQSKLRSSGSDEAVEANLSSAESSVSLPAKKDTEESGDAAGPSTVQLTCESQAAIISSLPRVFRGTFLSLLACLGIAILFILLGINRYDYVFVPILLYWTHCLVRISKAAAELYSCAKPMAIPLIWLISVLSFVCLLLRYNGSGFDPIVAWTLLQSFWPILFFRKICRQDHGHGIGRKIAGLVLYYFVVNWTISAPGQFVPWLAGQFGLIWYFVLALRSSASVKDLDGLHSALKEKDNILLNYKAFAAIDRWRQQQERALKQDMRTIVAVALSMFLLYWGGFEAIKRYQFRRAISDVIDTVKNPQTFPNPFADKASSSSGPRNRALLQPVDQESAEKSSQFVGLICNGFVLLFSFGLIFVLSKPTHIGLSPEGYRFLWRRRLLRRNGGYIKWSDIKSIRIEKPGGKTSTNDELLCFELLNGRSKRIQMGSIDSVEDRENLLKAIQKWAPEASRDASVIESLQAPADHSYTELWLQALSAPPKRERLKPLVPQTVLKTGTYRVIRQLGAGGQGQAYLAEDIKTGEEIVLKEFILPVFVDIQVRRSALEQFENEARILRQLQHPQIVKLVDFFLEDHRSYLVLEHINGASLREIVKKQGRLAEAEVRQLAQQMCEILVYLHGLQSPVVHRDFTPDNLILHKDGTLKLIDFNVAKQVVESTTSGTVVGKHAYLPPEQFRGMPEPASDLYAMGATLHYLLTGQDPEPISMSEPKKVNADLSDSINDLVKKATALDLQKRYSSAAEMLQDLERFA